MRRLRAVHASVAARRTSPPRPDQSPSGIEHTSMPCSTAHAASGPGPGVTMCGTKRSRFSPEAMSIRTRLPPPIFSELAT